MASKFKRRGTWYIRHKDESGKWTETCCGKESTAADADIIKKKWDSIELNTRHQMAVKIISAGLIEQLQYYHDYEVPRSNTGRPKSAKSVQRYRAIYTRIIAWCNDNGISQYSQFTNDKIRVFFDKLISDGMSASTISKYRQDLIRFFKWSIERGYCTQIPMTGIVNPKREIKPPFFWTENEILEIINQAYPPYKNIFAFAYLTGMRIGEIGNAEFGHFIPHLGLLRIPVMEGNKRKREIVIPLNDSAIAIIEEQKKLHKDKYIFLNGENGKLDNGNIYNNLMYTLKRAKIAEGSPHTLRHSFASHLAIKGVSLYIIKELLGHASIKETEQYSHLSKDSLKNAVNLIGI